MDGVLLEWRNRSTFFAYGDMVECRGYGDNVVITLRLADSLDYRSTIHVQTLSSLETLPAPKTALPSAAMAMPWTFMNLTGKLTTS